MVEPNSRIEQSDRPPSPRATDWLRFAIPAILMGAFVVAAWKLGYFDLKHPDKLGRAAQKAQDHPWFAVVFILAYAAIASFAAPVSPLAYAAGAMFHVVQGSIYVWVGSMIGAAAGYWFARGIWSDSARRLLGRYQDKLRDLKRTHAFVTVLRLQLLPIVPFGVFNYAAGMTGTSFAAFMLGTAIGIAPGSVAAVYVGDRLAAGFTGSGRSAFIVAAAVMFALLALSFLPALVRKLKKS